MQQSTSHREEKTRKIAALRQVIQEGERRAALDSSVATGRETLDAILPMGGWPRGGLSESIGPAGGGCLTLPLCAAARMTSAGELVALVDEVGDFHGPGAVGLGVFPSLLCVVRPPGGRRSIWSAEQLARSGRFALVILHRREALRVQEARMLRVAAEAGGAAVILVGCQGRQPPGIASLRLRVAATEAHGISVEVLRARGGSPGGVVTLSSPLEEGTLHGA